MGRIRHRRFRAQATSGLVMSFVAALVLAAPAGAAPRGAWNSTSPLSTGRYFAAAALLPNGHVLVEGGGDSSNQAVATSEIYDPSSGMWSPGPTMSSARDEAAEATLANGEVLIVGGQDATGRALASADLYNPGTNQFTQVPMNAARVAPSATLLANGEVLVAGGDDNSGNPLSTAELYNPASGTFVTTGSMATPRFFPPASRLDDGKVLVAGGIGTGFAPLSSGEVYSPATGAWTPVANSMSVPRAEDVSASLPGGRALVLGGAVSTAPSYATTSSTDIYNEASNTFSSGPSMSVDRALPGVVTLPDGRVVVAGGAQSSATTSSVTNSTDVYSPATNTFTQTGSLPSAVAVPAVVVLPDGRVLEAGGSTSPGVPTPTSTASLYTPTSAPSAPQNVTATAGNGSAAVTWTPPADDGGSQVTNYTVVASTGQTITTSTAATQATVAGLKNGTPVTFTVRAINAVGVGQASPPSGAVTPQAPRRPAAPHIKLSKIPRHLKLKTFLKRGLRFTVKPSQASSLRITLVGSANRATIARAYNLTLASKRFGRSARMRRVKLLPRRRLVGRPHRAVVRLVIVASTQAGLTRSVTKSIRVTR